MTRREVFATAATLGLQFLGSCSKPEYESRGESYGVLPSETVQPQESETMLKEMIYVRIGDQTLTVQLADNTSAEAFKELLEQGDIACEMSDYGGFEKVGALGTTLPSNDERITTEPGDLILYSGDQITIYYGTNTWRLTRLGKIQGRSSSELKTILGRGDVTVVFSTNEREGGAK